MAQQSLDNVISHWDALRQGGQVSVQELYGSVEGLLAARQIPGAVISRTEHSEGGLGSPKREYLRVTRDRLVFDISAGPFGTGFFISWWLVDDRLVLAPIVRVLCIFGLFIAFSLFSIFLTPLFGPFLFVGGVLAYLAILGSQAAGGAANDRYVEALPIIGWIYRRFFKTLTYYRVDTALAFQTAVHQVVLEAVDAIGVDKGLRALSDRERAPVMKDFFTRLK